MDYVLNFLDVDKNALDVVGGKNASLGELLRAGIRVPPGFAVTTDSYLQFITESGIKESIYALLDDINPEDVAALDQASDQIQKLITGATMSEKLLSAVHESYTRLCHACQLSDVPVAVRSSATAEDLPNASFAGQQDTYLWIQGIDSVLERTKQCWASLFTPRAIAYRINNDFGHEKVLISVGVQQMVNSRAAGVMFTLNPTDGDISKVVIEGSWGLGETVVSGSVNPDKFVVDKILLELNDKKISTKHIECVFDPVRGETVDADVPDERRCTCCLEVDEVKALVKSGKEIEKHYGRPMDIEWAIDRDLPFPENLFIVQARPETVWSQREKEPVIGNKTGRQLMMEQALKIIKLK